MEGDREKETSEIRYNVQQLRSNQSSSEGRSLLTTELLSNTKGRIDANHDTFHQTADRQSAQATAEFLQLQDALGKETKARKTAKGPFSVDNIDSMITPNTKLFICNMEKTSHEYYSDLKYLFITSDATQQKTLKVKGYGFILQISSYITTLVLLPLCETRDGWMDGQHGKWTVLLFYPCSHS